MHKEDPVAETIETYDLCAEEYAKKWGESWEDFKEFRKNLDEFMKDLPGKDVLEVGCGHGRDAKYLSERGINVTAIDLSGVFVEMASKNALKAKIMRMDMRQLKFPESSFDGILAVASFLHIPKKEAKDTLSGFNRILKPEGIIFISVKDGQGEGIVKKEFYNGKGKYFAFYTDIELRNLLESCGFKIKHFGVGKKINGTWLAVFAAKKQSSQNLF